MIRTGLAILAAYLAACVVVVLLFAGLSSGVFGLQGLIAGLVLALFFSLPGFVGLRLGLWAADLGAAWPVGGAAFALAGAANGILALSLAFGRPMAEAGFAGIGLAAGAAYWLVERRVAGRTPTAQGAARGAGTKAR
jgi:hypothetical protein